MTTPTGGVDLRRRWNRLVLRMQGGLDGDHADRVLPWLMATGLFIVLLALDAAVLRAHDGGSGLAPWLQAAWRRRHDMAGTPVAGGDPATGTWSVVAEPILWFTRYVPAAALFASIQAAAIALAVVPLWRLARNEARLRVAAAVVIVAAFALAPTLHRTNLTAFHPEVIALPALLWAYLHGRQDHHKRYWALVLVVLACRADLGLTVAAMGVLLMSIGKRRTGALTAAGGLAWSIVAVIALRPKAPARGLTPAGEFVARAVTPLAEFPRVFAHPIISARELLAEPSVLFLVVVLSPLLFLPLVAPRKLLPALPGLTLAMIADQAVQRVAQRGVNTLSPAAAHIAPAMAFVFIALVFALERVGEPSVTRVNVDRRVLIALLAGASLLFVTEAPSSPYRQPWRWGSRDATDGAREAAARRVGDDQAVAVSPQSAALVAERAHLVELPPRPNGLTETRVARIAAIVDVVLLDTTGTDPRTDQALWPTGQGQRVVSLLEADGFAVTYHSEGIYLLDRSGA